jgi:hypothetical protein
MTAGTTSLAPYLITAGATLGGVAITAVFAEYRERRRAWEERERERDRLTEERVKWLRQERRQSYAALIDVGYQAANLYLEASSRLFDRNDPDGAMELWRPLDALRDLISGKVADVELVGSTEVVRAARGLRRAFRRAPDLLIHAAQGVKEDIEPRGELSADLSPRVRSLFGAVHRLVDTAKRDLRIEPDDEEPDAEDQDKAAGPSTEHLSPG